MITLPYSSAWLVVLYVVAPRLGLLAAAWLTIVEFSRIYMGAHYPSDLMAGAALAATLVWASQSARFLSAARYVASLGAFIARHSFTRARSLSATRLLPCLQTCATLRVCSFTDNARRCASGSCGRGALGISDIVYAELCIHFEAQRDCDAFLKVPKSMSKSLDRYDPCQRVDAGVRIASKVESRTRYFGGVLIECSVQNQARACFRGTRLRKLFTLLDSILGRSDRRRLESRCKRRVNGLVQIEGWNLFGSSARIRT